MRYFCGSQLTETFMQNFPALTSSKRKPVPVELVVIGVIIAAGFLFTSRAPNAESPASGEAETPHEDSAPAEDVVQEQAGEPTEAASAVVSERPAGPPLPSGFPTDAPTLSGARLVSASGDPSTREYVLTWETSGSSDAVARAYGAQLAEKGWTVTSKTDTPESTVLVFERTDGQGSSRGWIAFLGTAPDVSATLTLTP
jgi:hypothetical protein